MANRVNKTGPVGENGDRVASLTKSTLNYIAILIYGGNTKEFEALLILITTIAS
jgi:hypothetical protein